MYLALVLLPLYPTDSPDVIVRVEVVMNKPPRECVYAPDAKTLGRAMQLPPAKAEVEAQKTLGRVVDWGKYSVVILAPGERRTGIVPKYQSAFERDGKLVIKWRPVETEWRSHIADYHAQFLLIPKPKLPVTFLESPPPYRSGP